MSNGRKTPPKTQYWCFTTNNPTIAEEEALKAYARGDACTYLIYGRERGDNGVPHFQGYVEFGNRQRLTAIKKIPAFRRAHLEPRRGTGAEAARYCKKDGDFVEFGEIKVTKQGRRTDLEEIKRKIDAGASSVDIADAHFSQWVIYRRSFDAYVDLKKTPQSRPELKVYVLCGASGTGKSSYVFSRHPECWISSNPVLRWFDGYTGQSTALIDDFNGECPFRFLLRLLDIYPMRVEVKGGHVAWNPTLIYITTNRAIDEWYGGERDCAPIQRRVKKVIRMQDLAAFDIGEKHLEIDRILAEE